MKFKNLISYLIILFCCICQVHASHEQLEETQINVQLEGETKEEAELLNKIANKINLLEKAYPNHPSLDLLKSIETMHYVQQNIRSYAMLVKKPKNTFEALEIESGACGTQVEIFRKVLMRHKIKTRAVSFYFIDKQRSNHAAVEVYIGNKWNFFDVNFGIFFFKNVTPFSLLSLEEVKANLKDLKIFQVKNLTNLNTFLHKCGGIEMPEFYLMSKTSQVLIDGEGILELFPSMKNGTEPYFDFLNVPGYVGTTHVLYRETPSTLKYKLKDIPSKHNLRIHITGTGGGIKNNMLYICSSEVESENKFPYIRWSQIKFKKEFPIKLPFKGDYDIELPNSDGPVDLELSVISKEASAYGYITLSSISLIPKK